MTFLLADLYRTWGAKATTATSGSEALRALAFGRHSLLVLSWELEEITARDILAAVETSASQKPGIIILTTRNPLAVPIRIHGQYPLVVPKPFQLDRLRLASWSALVRSWMSRAVDETEFHRAHVFHPGVLKAG
jgi:DNA-binding response OmpR family regulator